MSEEKWIAALSPQQRHVVTVARSGLAVAPFTALFVTGSLARGTGDRFSDVDMIAIVAPKSEGDACRRWIDVVGERFAPVMIKVVERPVTMVNVVDPDWTRIDLVIQPADQPFARTQGDCKPIWDPGNLWQGLPADAAETGATAQSVDRIVTEFLRILGLLSVVIGRNELLVGVSGAALLRQQLIALLVEEQRHGDPGGALHLNRLLTNDQRALLEGLPPLEATLPSVVAMHQACARAFLPRARALAARVGMRWPAAFEAAALQTLARAGVPVGDAASAS